MFESIQNNGNIQNTFSQLPNFNMFSNLSQKTTSSFDSTFPSLSQISTDDNIRKE